jgi:DNA-binding transcriptional MerR regulator
MEKLTQISFKFVSNEEWNETNKISSVNEEIMPENKTDEPVLIKKEETQSSANPEAKKFLSKRGRISLKEIDINADLIQIPPDEILFQKQYYPIGEVSKWFRVNQSLIRYWESEFDILQPRKNRKGDRFFRPVDVKNLLLIYDLLRRRKFTIEGAKDYLKKNKRAEEKFAMIQSLEKIKAFFLELKASL